MISHADTEPERRLWSAVILQAVIDLHARRPRHQQNAQQFFAGHDFDEIANTAGFEPEEIKRMRNMVCISGFNSLLKGGKPKSAKSEEIEYFRNSGNRERA